MASTDLVDGERLIREAVAANQERLELALSAAHALLAKVRQARSEAQDVLATVVVDRVTTEDRMTGFAAQVTGLRDDMRAVSTAVREIDCD